MNATTESTDPKHALMVSYLQNRPFELPESLILSVFEELVNRAEPATLRAWCHLFGKVWADRCAAEFDNAGELDSLNAQLNEFWSKNQWGWTQLREIEQGLEIMHTGAPLTKPELLPYLQWSCGLLEGFYEAVFKQHGADESMKVRVDSATPDRFSLILQLTA